MSAADVPLHPKLAADTVAVERWDLCQVLLMNDETYPWLILVPQRPDLRDFHDVAPSDQMTLMAEINRASLALQSLHQPDKINVAALGNMVPQLHIHVIARFRGDPAWPGPIWGAVPVAAYGADALDAVVDRLRSALQA
ncbi:MAG: HIT domain-containing protein [Methyloligellaceae bacterium]